VDVCAYVKQDAQPSELVVSRTYVTISSYMTEECEHATLECGIGVLFASGTRLLGAAALARPGHRRTASS